MMTKTEKHSISLTVVDLDSKTERRDAVENRERILETAESLFAEHGVANVCMAEIAKAAGVGKGTLYRRFANKGELCLALMDAQMRDFQDGILARMQRLSADGVPKLEQLDQFIDALVYFTETHSPLLVEVQREGMLLAQDGSASARLQLPHFWQHMTITGLLKLAVSEGELSKNVDVDYIADALLSPLKADIFHFQRTVRGFSLERISAGLRLIVVGLSRLD